jgi:CHAD domain-containing protein
VEPREVLLGPGTDPGEVSAALKTRYRVQVGAPSSGVWTSLDTADWRLHDAGLTLADARYGRRRALVLAEPGRDELTAPAPAQQWPRRVDALPASSLRDRIAAPVGVRALLPLAEVGVRSLSLQVLDDEDKTRVRMRVDQQRLLGDRLVPLPLRVLITPVRGYERDGQRCAELLHDTMPVRTDLANTAAAALAAAGLAPGQPSVPIPELDPQAPAAQSLALVLRRWLDIIDSVRPGVLADIDPEYLHELRTAVRATRSIISLAGERLVSPSVAEFAADFAWLGQLTAPLRDIDVALHELAGGGDTDLRGLTDLGAVQQRLSSQRRRALGALRTGLQSPRGDALSVEWRAALVMLAEPELPGASTRAAATAQAIAAYKRIVKAEASVTDRTHPDDLHRLRRRCKRMRYLLDAYASVYAPKPQRQVLSALKALQDCLGDIQDVHVQRQQLSDIAAALDMDGARTDTLLAIGAVRDRMLQREVAARRTLARRLARFAARETRGRVAALGTPDA